MRVGDIVMPRVSDTICTCGCGSLHKQLRKDLVNDSSDAFGPAIVTEFSNVSGNVYVRRPFEPHMVYVFRVEDLEVVQPCETNC